MRKRLATLMVGILALGGAIAGTSTASASSYDNTDPYATGCANGSYDVFDTNGLALRWSPACQTNWAQYDNQGGTAEIWVERLSPYATTAPFSYWGVAEMWSDQLYAPGPARACLKLYNNATGTWSAATCTSWSS